MDQLTDSLAVGVLRELARSAPGGRGAPHGDRGRLLPALKAFLQAEQHYRQGAWDSTRVYAEQAVALDTGFALAYMRLSQAIEWQMSVGVRTRSDPAMPIARPHSITGSPRATAC